MAVMWNRRVRHLLAWVLVMTFALVSAPTAWAIEPVFSESGVAIRGYDPVAYFTQDAPIEGNAHFSAEHGGAQWHFSSAEHRDLFIADPAKYAPQYGGYCAWAVANNYTAPIDPEAWSIKDGKLYLNYSKFVRARWALDKDGNIAQADTNWPQLRDAN